MGRFKEKIPKLTNENVDKRILALGLAKYTIVYGYKHNIYLKKLKKEWNNDSTDLAVRCADMQIEINNLYMVVLAKILKSFTVNCKHPKKYRDRTNDGTWYCMNCNSDLS